MISEAEFVADVPAAPVTESERFVLALDGFEGPLDVLLSLAREQKVDITKMSILALADQYLLFIQRARELRLDLAADYLVMAAWLAYLKSKLLLPQNRSNDAEPSGAELAEALAFQLRRLEAVREVVKRLAARPQKGIDFFPRGASEDLPVATRVVYELSLFDLLKTFGDRRRSRAGAVLAIRDRVALTSVEHALRRLERMIGRIPDWATLASFLPERLVPGLQSSSALASTFAASLELAKAGRLALRQDQPFGPIFVKRQESGS
jgi:segregation and condensation protein A